MRVARLNRFAANTHPAAMFAAVGHCVQHYASFAFIRRFHLTTKPFLFS
jgi:hypothetical protein